MLRLRNTILFILLFVSLILILRNHLNDRAFGDDLYVVWNSSYRLLIGDWDSAGKYSLKHADVGHPYLFYALIALGWRILGITPVVPHLLTILFASLTLLYTFKLGKFMFDWKVGLLSLFLLFSNPMFISSAAVIHLNIPLQAAYVICVYYFLKKKNIRFLLGLCGVVLFKAYGIVMAFGLFVSVLIYQAVLFKSHSVDMKKSIESLSPFSTAPLVLILFCSVRYFLTGHFLSSPTYHLGLQIPLTRSVGEYLANFRFMAWRRFLKQAEMSFVTLVPILSLLISFLYDKIYHRKSRENPPAQNQDKSALMPFYLISYIPVLITLLFFSLRSGGNLCTYMLPFLSLLYIAFSGSLRIILKKRRKIFLYIIVSLFCLMGIFRWHVSWARVLDRFTINIRRYLNNSNPMNLDVTRMPKVLMEAAQYIDENFPDGVVNATYPEAMAFEGEWTGYVKKKYDLFFDYDRSFNLADRYFKEGRSILYLYSGNKRLIDPQIYRERYQAELIQSFGKKGSHYYLDLWKMQSGEK